MNLKTSLLAIGILIALSGGGIINSAYSSSQLNYKYESGVELNERETKNALQSSPVTIAASQSYGIGLLVVGFGLIQISLILGIKQNNEG
jgi:hypothetical protein